MKKREGLLSVLIGRACRQTWLVLVAAGDWAVASQPMYAVLPPPALLAEVLEACLVATEERPGVNPTLRARRIF